MCLTYNLIAGKSSTAKKHTADLDDAARLATAIKAHVAKQPSRPLVFAFEHQYTQAGLTAELLKGADRSMADLIKAAASPADYRLYLAQVSRHLCQAAEEQVSRRRDYWRSEESDVSQLEIGETCEDDLNGEEWRDFSGKRQSFGVIPFDRTSIVSKTPLDDWAPTSEEYEGYTGNGGNTLDRWNYRSAMVLWHADHHFDVIAQGNLHDKVCMYFSILQKLDRTQRNGWTKHDGIVCDSRGLLFAPGEDVQVLGVTVNPKMLDSYERAKKQHADDLKLLTMLEAILS